MSKFPNVIAAAKNREKTLWELGNALIKDCGPPSESHANDGSRAKIAEAAEELQQQGFSYTAATLLDIRDTAATFPEGRRRPGVTFWNHKESQNEKMLDLAIKRWNRMPKEERGKRWEEGKPTTTFIRDLKNDMKEIETRDEKAAPERRNDVEPKPRSEAGMNFLIDLTRNVNRLGEAVETASEIQKWVGRNQQRLESADTDYLVEKATELAEAARALAAELRPFKRGRGRLSVVGA